MNKEEKYDYLVKFLRAFDLHIRNIDTSMDTRLFLINNGVQSAMTRILNTVEKLEKK